MPRTQHPIEITDEHRRVASRDRISPEAASLLHWVSDASFDCGEWSSADEGETYEQTHNRAKRAQRALTDYIRALEGLPGAENI